MSRLVRTLNRYTNIVSLLLAQLGKLSTKLSEVKSRHFLIQMLRQHINLLLILPTLPFIPKLKLSNNLVRKRTRHHKARVAGSTSQVHQTLWFDCDSLHTREGLETVHVNLIVKVTNVANNCINLKTFHESLEGTDGIDFGYDNTGTSLFQCNGTALSYVSITTYNTDLSGYHHVCGPHQIPLRINLQRILNQTQHKLKLNIISRTRVRNSTRFLKLLLSLHTLMNQKCSITTIIHNQVGPTAGAPIQSPLSAPPVLLQRLSFPGEDGGAVAGYGGGGVVLGGEDGFDKDGGLDGHVETSSDSGAFERLGWTELGPTGHESGHFNFSKFDFETAEVGLGHVLDLKCIHKFPFSFFYFYFYFFEREKKRRKTRLLYIHSLPLLKMDIPFSLDTLILLYIIIYPIEI
ncbi:hypothetical protein ACJIZ3_018088 [Penstemon smallii]|uniref:Uncharacterized protein n=1 Tax=Penstemon smallii TaxID=265156 RepID=A0ABD3SY70_9LAMI